MCCLFFYLFVLIKWAKAFHLGQAHESVLLSLGVHDIFFFKILE